MRLGGIARDLGHAKAAKRYYDAAQKYADEASEAAGGRKDLPVDVTASLGLMYLKMANLKDAQVRKGAAQTPHALTLAYLPHTFTHLHISSHVPLFFLDFAIISCACTARHVAV